MGKMKKEITGFVDCDENGYIDVKTLEEESLRKELRQNFYHKFVKIIIKEIAGDF